MRNKYKYNNKVNVRYNCHYEYPNAVKATRTNGVKNERKRNNKLAVP